MSVPRTVKPGATAIVIGRFVLVDESFNCGNVLFSWPAVVATGSCRLAGVCVCVCGLYCINEIVNC